jgi:hypothetical protein
MNFLDYFTNGLGNTLKFKNRANFSYKGEVIPVQPNTVIDKWAVGNFSSAEYEIAVEYGNDDVETLRVTVSARPGQASITAFGRTNLGRDLVKFTATVDNSFVSVIASPYYQADAVTALVGVRLTYKATYAERLTAISVPTTTGETTSAGGAMGFGLNWRNTNIDDGFGQVSDDGGMTISNIKTVIVNSTNTLNSKFILDTINIQNTDGNLAITTVPTPGIDSLTFALTNIPNLTVTGSVTATLTQSSSINNVQIGSIVPAGGRFTTISSTGAVALSSPNAVVSLAPTGTGTVTINPVTAGRINNVRFGATTPRSARFTSITVTQPTTNNSQLVSLAQINGRLLLGAI